MRRTNLTDWDDRPEGMVAYLRNYGPHFNRKLSDFAASMMERKEGRIKPYQKQDVDMMLKNAGVEARNAQLYDCVYVANMCQADFLGSSIQDAKHVALYIKDVLDDPDASDGQVFNRFYADCCWNGIAIDWDEML